MPRLIAPIEKFDSAIVNSTLHGRSEEWMPLPGWSAYQIGSLGRVRRCLPGKGTWVGRVLRPNRLRQGYLIYRLMQNGRQRDALGHVLVAEAFLGGIPPGKECNHRNGVKEDNRLENIEVITHAENLQHADRIGLRNPRKPNLKNRGANNGMARIDDSQVIAVKMALLAGRRPAELAKEFGVPLGTVSKIKRGYRWAHLEVSA